MEPKRAHALGSVLLEARKALGLSSTKIAELTDIDQATVIRLERGSIAKPDPEKLARVAEALGLNVADVFEMANYTIPSTLPSFKPYLRTKYGQLPPEDIEAIEKYAARLAKKHGIALSGPSPGEDEH